MKCYKIISANVTKKLQGEAVLMKVIICDNKMSELSVLISELEKDKEKEVLRFDCADNCIDFLTHIKAELIFISVEFENNVHEKIIDLVHANYPETVICLLGSIDEQCVNMRKYKCEYFLKRSSEKDEIIRVLDILELITARNSDLKIITFGQFSVIVKNIPVNFHNSKAKELLALCIDKRGSAVSCIEAIDNLWPGREYDEKSKKLYRKAVLSIIMTLNENGIKDFFFNSKEGCIVKTEGINCDYFLFSKNPERYISLFNGNYMSDYSWGEKTLGRLTSIANKYYKKAIL